MLKLEPQEIARLRAIAAAAPSGAWRVELEPYPHLRSDAAGCLVARDYLAAGVPEFVAAFPPHVLVQLLDALAPEATPLGLNENVGGRATGRAADYRYPTVDELDP